MRPNWKLVWCCAVVGVASSLLLVAPTVPADQSGSATVLPNGWKVTPAGRIVALAGDMPLRVLPLPDGRRALVLTGGYHDHSLSIVDIAGGKILHSLELGKDWAGLAADTSGSTVYVSGGGPVPNGFERNLVRTLAGAILSTPIKLCPSFPTLPNPRRCPHPSPPTRTMPSSFYQRTGGPPTL